MGRRIRKLKCNNCNNEFWNKFEHVHKDSVTTFIQSIICDECSSSSWTIQSNTRFSGGRERRADSACFICRNCRNEMYHTISGLNQAEFKDLLENMTCSECGEQNDVKMGDMVE